MERSSVQVHAVFYNNRTVHFKQVVMFEDRLLVITIDDAYTCIYSYSEMNRKCVHFNLLLSFVFIRLKETTKAHQQRI